MELAEESLCLFSGTRVNSAPDGNWGDAVDFDFPPRQKPVLNKQRDENRVL
jgi:hypothetical protein